MGGWHLEVFKMGIYMMFPVAMFHIFNQPAYFEEWVTKKKRELYPPDNTVQREAIQQAIRHHQEKMDKKQLHMFEEMGNSKTN